MKLSTRYALYLTFINFVLLVSVFFTEAWLFTRDIEQLTNQLKLQTRQEYTLVEQKKLKETVEHISRYLTPALQTSDTLAIHELLEKLGVWFSLENAFITDSYGNVLFNFDNYHKLSVETKRIEAYPSDVKLVSTELDLDFTQAQSGILIQENALGYHVISPLYTESQLFGYLGLYVSYSGVQHLLDKQNQFTHQVLQQFLFNSQIIELMGLTIIVVVSVLASYYLSYRVSLPLKLLTHCVENLSQRDFSPKYINNLQKIHISYTDELSILAYSFEKMVIELQDFVRNLEYKVKVRTAEVELAFEELNHVNQLLEKENLRIATELEVSREFQYLILPRPQELKAIQDLDISAYMQPAEEIGGDYYDVLCYNDHTRIAIGDVTGHGLSSAIIMLMVQTSLRTLFANDMGSTDTCLTSVNRMLYDNIQRMESDKNLTLTVVDYYQGKAIITGQHEEVLVVRANGEVEEIDTVDLGFPIGLEANIDSFVACKEIELKSGDGLVLYTDGITEAENADKELYGLSRLCCSVQYHWEKNSSQEIQDGIIRDVLRHIGSQKVYDDITLIVLKKE
ncbi:SpoIIE family protein phosphatase [Candidatus Albibeggiatoa sp. nov. NOAA]|uniref:SpoIIE family protein phosphatase n=1 Tax=Candidatus Albibeggiatoa sp. nov. NOAA TaxID=3162724 RepID=UPI0032F0BE72|nr:SpoIIE family protein phosphatase [Thiotrichaceae bacterium]